MAAAINTKHLVKTFSRKGGGVEAVRDVSFTVEHGERVACIGPNGAGKSTTIKMLTGILHPTSGEAAVLGFTPWKQRRELAASIGVLFGQRSQLWAELPVRNGLGLLGAIYGIEKRQLEMRIEELAEVLDARDLLSEPVRNLSLGQRMRCELAASLLHAPKLLFLDEPTIGLDLVAKQRFRELLVSLNETSGATIFLTSHDIADVEAVAQRTIIINHGQVLHDAPTDDLAKSLLSTKLINVRFHGDVAPAELPGVHVEVTGSSSRRLTVDVNRNSVKDVLDHILSTCDVADIEVSDPPLEDVIAQIYESPVK